MFLATPVIRTVELIEFALHEAPDYQGAAGCIHPVHTNQHD